MNDGHQMDNNTVKISVGVAEGKVKVQFDHNYKISLVASARACARKEGGWLPNAQCNPENSETFSACC